MAATTSPGAMRLIVGFAALLLLGGVALTAFGAYLVGVASASNSWTAVEGRIVGSRVISQRGTGSSSNTSRSYHVAVRYSYEVNGERLTSSRYSLGDGNTASKRFPRREAAEAERQESWRVGRTLTVYFDPDDPSEAVIAKGLSFGTFVPLILGPLLAGLGAFSVFAIRRGRQVA